MMLQAPTEGSHEFRIRCHAHFAEEAGGPYRAPPVVGEASDVIGDDRFEAMLDRALEVAFAPIIEEYRTSRERSLADAAPVSPEPVAAPPRALPGSEAAEDPAVPPTPGRPSDEVA